MLQGPMIVRLALLLIELCKYLLANPVIYLSFNGVKNPEMSISTRVVVPF